eukprot:gene15169-biopygen5173
MSGLPRTQDGLAPAKRRTRGLRGSSVGWSGGSGQASKVPVWEKRQRTRTGRGAHDRIQTNGRRPDAGSAVSPTVTGTAAGRAGRLRAVRGGGALVQRRLRAAPSRCLLGPWSLMRVQARATAPLPASNCRAF